jgi:hypothetical protein
MVEGGRYLLRLTTPPRAAVNAGDEADIVTSSSIIDTPCKIL